MLAPSQSQLVLTSLFPDPELSLKVNLSGILPWSDPQHFLPGAHLPQPHFSPPPRILKCLVPAEFSEPRMTHPVHFSECKKKQTIPVVEGSSDFTFFRLI